MSDVVCAFVLPIRRYYYSLWVVRFPYIWGATFGLHSPSMYLDDLTAGLRMDCWHRYAHLLLFYCQFWLDMYKQAEQSTSYGLFRALMTYDSCVLLYPQDLVDKPLVLDGSDRTNMALFLSLDHLDEPEVSFEYWCVGPWVISLVPYSCMPLLQVNVGTRASQTSSLRLYSFFM